MSASVAGGAGSGEKLAGCKFKIGDSVYFDTLNEHWRRWDSEKGTITGYAYIIQPDAGAPGAIKMINEKDIKVSKGGLRRRKTRRVKRNGS